MSSERLELLESSQTILGHLILHLWDARRAVLQLFGKGNLNLIQSQSKLLSCCVKCFLAPNNEHLFLGITLCDNEIFIGVIFTHTCFRE